MLTGRLVCRGITLAILQELVNLLDDIDLLTTCLMGSANMSAAIFMEWASIVSWLSDVLFPVHILIV